MDCRTGRGIAGFLPSGELTLRKLSADYRFMEYNILHQAEGYANEKYLSMDLNDRKTEIAKIINNTAPDVLFLAERFEEWDGIGNGSVDLMAALNSDYALIENEITYSLSAGGTATATNRSPIVYNTKVFKVIESGYVFLTDVDPPEYTTAKRCVTWAILEDITETEAKGTRIAVFGTHWSVGKHWTTGESLEEMRIQEAEEMSDLIKSDKFKGLPVITGGDFNSHYTSETKTECYVTLLESAGLVDVSAAMATEEKPYIYGGVDHFAVSGCTVESFTIIWNTLDYASDHNPIYCDIKCDTKIDIYEVN